MISLVLCLCYVLTLGLDEYSLPKPHEQAVVPEEKSNNEADDIEENGTETES